MERASANLQQWHCIVEAVWGAKQPQTATGFWYDEPLHLQSGQTIPIGTMVQVALLWNQIQQAAEHPYVERIDAPPGESALWGQRPPTPAECPPASDEPHAKLTELTSIQGQGRKPAIIDLRDELLPEPASCATAPTCAAGEYTRWERAIVSKRQVACVRRWLDSTVADFSRSVPYGVLSDFSASAVVLPPFGDVPGTLLSFGVGLTWEEASLVATHPFVKRIWTFSDLEFDDNDGCEKGAAAAVTQMTCPAADGSPDGKINEMVHTLFAAAPGVALPVMISVRGGARVCALATCPAHGESCPERDAQISGWEASNLNSQQCVRQFIAMLGGQASMEVFWLANIFGSPNM